MSSTLAVAHGLRTSLRRGVRPGLILTAGVVLLMTSGCADESTAHSPAPSSPSTPSASVGADSLVGQSFSSTAVTGTPIPGGGPFEITFPEGGRVSMTAGCNRHIGGVRIDGDTMTFTQLAATMMACPPPRDTADTWVTDLTDGPVKWQREGQELTLSDGTTTVTLSPTK